MPTTIADSSGGPADTLADGSEVYTPVDLSTATTARLTLAISSFAVANPKSQAPGVRFKVHVESAPHLEGPWLERCVLSNEERARTIVCDEFVRCRVDRTATVAFTVTAA